MFSEITNQVGACTIGDMNSNVNQDEYIVRKIIRWRELLIAGSTPTRWNKPTKKGTRVFYKRAKSAKEIQDEQGKLKEILKNLTEIQLGILKNFDAIWVNQNIEYLKTLKK